MKRGISVSLRILVSASLLTLLFYLMRDKLDEVFFALKSTNIPLFLLAFLFIVGMTIVISARLKKLMSVQKANISLKETAYLTYIGYFFNNFLPTAIGGDLAKAHYASKSTNLKLECFTSVFMDRLIGLVTLVMIGLIGAFASVGLIKNNAIIYFFLGLVAFALFICAILLNKGFAKNFKFLTIPIVKFGIEEKLKKVYDAINNYRNHRGVVGIAILFSVLAQTLCVLAIYTAARSLSVHIPIASLFFVVPVAAALGMVPSINGLGVREGAFVYCLKNMVPPEKALAIALLFLGLMLLNSIVGGIIYFLKEGIRVI